MTRKYIKSKRGGVEVEFKKDTEKAIAKERCINFLRQWAGYYLSDNFRGIERDPDEEKNAKWILDATTGQLMRTLEIVVES